MNFATFSKYFAILGGKRKKKALEKTIFCDKFQWSHEEEGGGGQRRFDICHKKCFFLKASLTWQLILCHSLEIGWSLTIPENITDAF